MNSMYEYSKKKSIMGKNFLGIDEIKSTTAGNFKIWEGAEEIPFTEEELYIKRNTHMLILGTDMLEDGTPVSIKNMIHIFGKNPSETEPCFYNQDWYENEKFIDEKMEKKWFFIRKNVYEDSRGVLPDELVKMHSFPKAIECTYAFFLAWLIRDEKLWMRDFVWCRDYDHNGDRVYVGRYYDPDGINKNGFNIHRHLSLRPCYACID